MVKCTTHGRHAAIKNRTLSDDSAMGVLRLLPSREVDELLPSVENHPSKHYTGAWNQLDLVRFHISEFQQSYLDLMAVDLKKNPRHCVHFSQRKISLSYQRYPFDSAVV